MSLRAKTVRSRVLHRLSRPQQTISRSRRRMLLDAVNPLIEMLEVRQLLSASGIGVNFTGGGNGGSGAISMASTDTAGVIPIANYNNVNGGSATATTVSNLTNSTGAASPVTMTYTAGGTWNSVGSTVTPANGDQELNDGFVFGNSDVQLTGIPYANYDVYVYELNDGAGRVQQTTDVTSGQSVYGSSANPTDANHESGVANNYLYIAANGTSSAPTPTADFAAFSGSTSSFEFQTSVANGNGYLNGFEIVDHTTTAPVLNTTTAGKGAIALAWTYGTNAQSGNFTYTVYRSDASHPAAAIATGVTAEGYTDTTAVNGTAYTYYVVANNSVGPSANSNSLTATASASATLGAIGVNFSGGGNGPSVDMTSTDTAGIVPIDNYNNWDGGSNTGVTLNDNTGTATPVTLSVNAAGTWNSSNSSNVPTVTGDQELNNGFLFTNGTNPDDFQLTGIPYANYDVYVYELNDGSGRPQVTTDINTGAFVVGTSANPGDAVHESGTVNNYQYIAANGTTAAPTANADFAAFAGSSSNFEFQAYATVSNGYINGFEIVNHTNTAPTLTQAFPANGAVGLSWTYGNAQAQSNTFTYTIYRSDASHPAAVIATGVTGQSYTDSTAANGTAYTYYVVANNGIGPSANSNSLSATPFAGPPQAPTGITATRTSATSVTIAYNVALGATGYDVKRGTSLNPDGSLGGTITDITPGGTTQTSVVDSSALPSGYYAVTASNSSGSSPASIAVFVDNGDGWQASYYTSDVANTIIYDGDQTANQAYTQPDGTAIPATITQPAATNNPPVNNAVLGFQRNENTPINDVNFNATTPPPNSPSNFNTIEGGNVGADFAVRWVGYIEAPYTGYYTLNPNSDDGVAVTVYDSTHLTGGNPTPVTLQPDNIFLPRGQNTDDDPVVDSTGAPVQWIAGQKYLVQMDYQQQGGGWQAQLSYSVSSSAANRTAGTYDILPQTLIPVSQVLAPVATFQTIDAANPTGLAKDNPYYSISSIVGPGEVQLTFANIGADSYNIYRSTSPSGPFTTPIANVPETNGQAVVFTDTGLTNGTTYYYVITGVDLSGETPIASGKTISATPAAVAPAAPTNLTATRVDAYNVALNWSPSVFATSYDVKRGTVLNADGSLGGTVVDVTPGGTTNTSATDTNAFQQTTYYYQVTASDAGGTSARSNTATVAATFSLVHNPFAVNFVGGGNGGGASVSLSAGVVATTAWNNETGTSGSGNITAADGTTTASLTYTDNGTWNNGVSTATGNGQLLNGYLDTNNTSPVVTISGLTGSAYDVYVYTEGDNANTPSNYVINGVDNMVDETPAGGSAALTLDPTDTALKGGPGGTYLVNFNVAPQSGTITITSNTDGEFRSPINGIELVEDFTAGPTAAPVLSPATAGSGGIALNWTSVPEATSYTVYRTDPSHPTPAVVATNVATTSYTDSTVAGGVTYTYTVAADNQAGEGPKSNAESATASGTGLPTWLSASSVATWNSSTHTLTVTGAATITSDPGTDEPNIVASGSAAQLTITPATSPTDVHVGNISLSGGAGITMTSVASRSHSNHNVLVIGPAGAANDPTVSIDSTSKLDLGSNDLIVHTGTSDTTGASELTAWRALAQTGRGVPAGSVLDGTWTGNGLTSSAAAATDKSAGYEETVLAVIRNNDQILGTDTKWTVGTASEAVGAKDIIVKYTYNGDAAMEGFVGDDSVTIVNGLYDGGKSSQPDWAFGDFTGSGGVNDDDITILNGLYGNGTASSGLPVL